MSDEQHSWRNVLREFCRDVVAPGAASRDENRTFDLDLVRAVARLGVFELIDDRSDPPTIDVTSLSIAVEELARVDSSLAVTVHVQAMSAALFAQLAPPGLRRELLPKMTAGEEFVAFGLTEPSGGSDAGNIATTAVRDGDEWVINGAKQFITNSGTPLTKYVIVFTATGAATNGRPPVTAFLVPTDAPGFTVGEPYRKLGWRSSDTHPLFFDNIRVPHSALLGEEGRGYRAALEFLTWSRIPIAAMAVGLAQGCLDESLEFVEGRTSFGRPLGAHQALAFSLADLAAMVTTSRVVTYDAAWRHDHGHDYEHSAAVAKLVAAEMAMRAASIATQVHGGYGFMDDSPVTRHFRDARILTIGEGSSEVQRMLIARQLGLPT